jgi:ubiquinone/menaquinone biosynthesis C-methylase UbiE
LPAQDDGAGRDAWQRPAEVLDALGVREGSVVADVGCGDGYFTFHLARRVGASGRVYAVDIDKEKIAAVRARAMREKWTNVEALVGEADDPKLPAAALDAVLVADTYHEFTKPEAMLAGIQRALKPGGLLAVIDAALEAGKPRVSYRDRHRIPEEIVREEAARSGFRFLEERPGFERPTPQKQYYFLIFAKP